MALMENECELKRFVLSALKYGRFQSLNSPLIALIACISIGLPPCVCLYKKGRSSLTHTHNRSHLLAPPQSFLSLLLPPVIPSRPPRTRLPGEQASETPPLHILYGRGAIRFLGSVSYATARLRSSASTTSAPPSSSPWPPTPTSRRLLLTRGSPTRLPPPLLRPTGLLEGIICLSLS